MKIRRLTDTGEWTTRRYLSLLGTLLIWGIVAIDAWYLWPTQLGGDTSIVVVSGHSMEPTFFGGDLVIARKMEPSVGDVIVYAPEGFGGSQIVHRIVDGNAADGWVMQGDNNPRVDPFTPKGDEVKGVVLVHYANFGRVTVLLLNPMVWAFVLLAAMVLMLWYTGDDCDDDDEDDKEKDESDGGPEPEVEEELDLIDRVVEGTEAAVSRMVSSGAEAGAAALAMLTRPSPSPRHATSAPRHSAPTLLRGSAIVALLGVLAIYGPSTASASSLSITTSGNMFTKTYMPCTTATLGVTYSGTATPSGSTTKYPKVKITGLSGCEGLKLSYTAYDSNGQTVTSGTNITVTADTHEVTPTATYDASLVKSVIVMVNGWPLTNAWTGPPPPAPAGAMIRCYQVNPGGNRQVEFPCNPTINPNGGEPWNYDGGTQMWNFSFTVESPNGLNWKNGMWYVEFDFSQSPPYPGFTPGFVGTTWNSGVFSTASNSCTDLPIFRLQSAQEDGSRVGLHLEIGDGGAPSWYSAGNTFCP